MKSLRSRVVRGDTLLGCFLNLGSSLTAEIVGLSGFDWVVIDLEHGAGSEHSLLHQLQALQHTPAAVVVRLESHDRQRFHRVLDLGADGVMVPRMDTIEQAQAAAAALRFPPAGVRGVAKINRACGFGTKFEPYVEQAPENLLGIVQIESEAGLQNLDAITAVDGVDAIFVGPLDLSYSLGIPCNFDHPRYQDAIQAVASSAKRHGKAAGILLRDVEELPRYRELGYRLLACGSDGDLVNRSARLLASKLREGL